MRFSSFFWSIGCIAVVLAATYAVHVAGINRAVGRGVYVNAMFIREEAKCLETNDIECLRVHWRFRAQAVAESARRLISGFGWSSEEGELQEYIQWVGQLPSSAAGKK
jgi:hypothetical protein